MFIQNYDDLDEACKEQAETACKVGQRMLDLKSGAHPELVKLFKSMCLELSVKTRRQVEVLDVRGMVFMNFRTEPIPLKTIQALCPNNLIRPQMAEMPANMADRINSQWRW